jgi:aspartyl-tRNA(Asn)/glutamyl-tRNA(Gln) amidotransferase subunit A
MHSHRGDPGADLTALHLHQAAELVRRREVSPVELTRACLARIERLNPTLNAFITVTAEAAVAAARAAEAEIQRGNWRGPLHGLPVALKDLIDTAGVRTTAASALVAERVPAHDAEVVRRLKAAGAVLIGKTNLHEFAYGGSSLISHFGVVRNPRDPSRIAGGSSGGSAAAVAAGLCYAALGTDTAGSIREPAAFCGIVGLKPSYGLVSTRGVLPLSYSLDHVGPMTRSVRDAALVLEAIAGFDPEDPGSHDYGRHEFAAACERAQPPLRVGVARDFFFTDLDADVAACIDRALQAMRRLGAELREVAIPVNTDRTVQSGEAYAYHARFVAESPQLYQPETLRRIRSGADITAAAYIAKRRELDLLRRAAPAIFAEVDVLLTPTTPVLPPPVSELQGDIEQLRRRELIMLRNTRPFDVLGLPAISVPCGLTPAGLPVGVQIAGPPGGDALMLQAARAFESMQQPVEAGG